ncbi:MAG: hemolysin family protein [Candidatus Nanopelagicales bacterium]|nr:hemolysin family protein [Candidatus Nanopelagicales bacterium]
MNSTIGWIVVVILLLFFGAYFVAAETALSRVSRSRVEELRREGNLRAITLLNILDDRPRYVNVLFFLSTVAAVSATVLVADLAVTVLAPAEGWSTTLAVLVAVIVMIIVSYVGLGVAPRTLGRQNAERIALSSANFIRLLGILLAPLATLLILIGNAITPGKGFRQGPFDSEADLRELVDLAGAEALIEDEERQMIHSVFELGDTFSREVMVPRTDMIFIERNKSLRQAVSLCLRSGYSRIPVIGEDADNIVGVVYLKDMVRRTFEHHEAGQSERVESIMREAYFVPDSKPVDVLLRDMQAARVHIAIVVDEYGGTAGLVTIEDILEEIVGEITDEYDTAAPEVTPLPDGSFRVMARMNIDDFAELIDIEIDSDEEGVETVLGLMARRLGRVPIVDAEIVEGGWTLRAEQGAGRRNRVGTILAQPEVVEVEVSDE